MVDLARQEQIERLLEPEIVSTARPEPADLLQARADVQSDAALQDLFTRGLPPEELASTLTEELRKRWPDGDPAEAARFLADEYSQIGPEGIQLVSTETGRIAAILREEDLYQPAPVPREGGGLATPLPRIRPDLEAAVITWFHSKGRDQAVLDALAKRGHQTALLRDMGDPRLLVATRRGRKHIVESLAKFDPKTLLEATGGTAGAFLQLFTLDAPPPELYESLRYIRGTVVTRSVMGVQDALTTNLHHNRPATLRGALVQGWVREMARILSSDARGTGHKTFHVDYVEALPPGFWVAPPDMVRPFRKRAPNVMVLPVEASVPTTIDQNAGFIKVPEAFQAHNLEIFERWEASTALDFEMWVFPDKVHSYEVLGVEVLAQVL